MPESAQPDLLLNVLRRVRWGVPLLIFIVGILITAVLFMQILHPSHYLAGDSFTYFNMVRVFHDTGLLYSYSGIDHATGVHPGYYFFLIPLYLVFGLSIPVWSFIFNGLLLAGGLYLCYRVFGLMTATVMLLLVGVAQGSASTNNGMESSLLFLTLSATAYLLSRIAGELPTTRQSLALGFFLGAAVFIRLDTVFFVVTTLFFLTWYGLYTHLNRVQIKKLAWSLACIGIPLFVWMLLIFAINLHYDGTLVPLSGKLKSSFPHLSQESFTFPTLWLLKVFIVSIVVGGMYLLWRACTHRQWGILLPALVSSSIILFLYNALFVLGIGAWYGALPFFALALTAGLFARDVFSSLSLFVFRSSRSLVFGFFCVLALGTVLVTASHFARQEKDWLDPYKEAVAFLTEHALPGETAGEFMDGVFAFYSVKVPVYSLTGLGNNKEYVEALRSGTLGQYLKEKNIRYILSGGSGIQVPGATQFLDCSHAIYDRVDVKIYATDNCLVVPSKVIGESLR